MELVIFALGLAAGIAIARYFHRQSSDTPPPAALQDELETLRHKNLDLEKQVVKLDTERSESDKKIALLERSEERLKTEFENLSTRIFEDRSQKFKQQNKEELGNILKPLNDQLQSFNRSFTETDKSFSEKFGELKQQITGLSELNKSIGEQAQNLTSALKGDVKQQGDWGELILEKTLEISGLRKDIDYHAQQSYSDEDGRKIVDVIVHLPDKKDIVIDSKVSLTAYEAYTSAEDEAEKERQLKNHIGSIKAHIKGLSGKNYQNLDGVRTLNFVLMFIPIEAAYLLTVQNDRDIFQDALNSNIVLVCPSTLLAVLRTVHALWRLENQNANAREIAEQAGKLYDKFAGFVGKMEGVGSQLDKASRSYDDAYKSLASGRGNLISRADKIKKLGARASKNLPDELVEEAKDSENTPALPDDTQ